MYTPILKWKLGEKKALQNLSDEVSKKFSLYLSFNHVLIQKIYK